MRRRLALVVAIAAVALGLAVPVAASAGCIGPELTTVGGAEKLSPTGPPSLTPGAALVVHGRWFFDTCNDTVENSGCAGPTGAADPSRDVRLTLTQGSRSWLLGRASASAHSKEFAIHWDVRVPPDVSPGPATLSAGIAKASVVVR